MGKLCIRYPRGNRRKLPGRGRAFGAVGGCNRGLPDVVPASGEGVVVRPVRGKLQVTGRVRP